MYEGEIWCVVYEGGAGFSATPRQPRTFLVRFQRVDGADPIEGAVPNPNLRTFAEDQLRRALVRLGDPA